jgi:hypothetical protein
MHNTSLVDKWKTIFENAILFVSTLVTKLSRQLIKNNIQAFIEQLIVCVFSKFY